METTAEVLWDRLLRSDPGPASEDVYRAMLMYPELRKRAWPIFLDLEPYGYEVARVFKNMPELRREAVNAFLGMDANDSEIVSWVTGEDEGSVALAEAVLERLEAAPVTTVFRFLLFFFRFARVDTVGMRNHTLRKIIELIPGLRSRAWKELKARYPSNYDLYKVMEHFREVGEEAARMLLAKSPSLYDLEHIAEYVPTLSESIIEMALSRFNAEELIEHVRYRERFRESVRSKLFGADAVKENILSWLTVVRDDYDLALWNRFLGLTPTDIDVCLVALSGHGNRYVPLAINELHRRNVLDQEILGHACCVAARISSPYFDDFVERIDLAQASDSTLRFISRYSKTRGEVAGRELLTRCELTNGEIDEIVHRHDSLRDLARTKVKPTTDQVMHDLQARKNRESA